MDKFNGKAKMYLQEDNSGFGLLITDGFGHWFYWGENDLSVELTENAAINVRILQDAINSGEMYDAKDFINECLDREIYARHIIPRYIKAVNVNDIAAIENCERNCDFITWYYVNKED